METVSNVPTVAANKPVCVLKVYVCNYIEMKTRTHKNEGAICIFLTTFCYVIVVLLYNLAVRGVEWPRAITIVEFLLWYL